MKKLYVKIGDTWALVFCNNGGKIITTDDKRKALPTAAMWAQDDLNWFQTKFANHEFKLA